MNYVLSNRRLSVIAIALLFMIILISQSPATAQIAYIDNTVDSDSDWDSVANKGSSAATSYLDAQAFDTSNETILETDIGRGTSQVNENWTNYKYININHHQVTGDLNGFPVLVSIFDEDIKRNAQSDGDDIAFFDISGIQLSHEIETYDPNYNATHAQLIAWVNADLSSSTDTRLTVKYGNSAMSSQANSAGVWNSDYAGVWHLPDNPPTSIIDSTSNSNDGTGSGTIVTNVGKISDGTEFSDTFGQTISIANSASLTISNTLTVSAWIKPDVTNIWQTILSKSDGIVGSAAQANEDLYLVIDNAGEYFIGLTGGSGTVEWNTPYDAIIGAWQYITFSYDSGTSIGSFYINGILQGTNNYGLGTLNTNSNPFYIGYNRVFTGEIFDGVLDEVKFSNIVKSADWINTEYNNQNNPEVFHSVSNELFYNDPWEYYKLITIDNSKVSGDVNDFPVFLTFIDEDLKTHAQTDGDDIAFFDNIGKQLPHEIISYNPNYSGTEAELLVWVQADLSGSINTTITMKYGDSALSSQQNPTAVWDSNYAGVWHLNENPASGATIFDSTINNNDGTAQSTLTSDDQITGKLGNGIELDYSDTNDYIIVPNSPSLDITGNQITLEAWVYLPSLPNPDDAAIIEKAPSVNVERYMLGVNGTINPSNLNHRVTTSNGQYRYDTGTINAATWTKLVMVYDGSLGSDPRFFAYVDGVLVSSNSAQGTLLTTTSDVLFGRRTDGRKLGGWIDELRISNTVRSAQWIETEFNNQNSPSTFYSLGSEFSLDQSDPATSLIRTYEDPVDNIYSNLDGIDDQGIHSNFNNEQDKDGIFDTLTESLPNAYSLDSTGIGYMEVGTGGSADWRSSQGTISFWIHYTNLDNDRPWGLDAGMMIRDDGGNRLRTEFDGGTVSTVTTMAPDKWYFIAVSWNDQTNNLAIYFGDENTSPIVEGSTSSWSGSVTSVPLTSNTFLTPYGVADREIIGYGDELRYWNIERSTSEIQSDYNKLLNGTENNLRSYFRLDNDLQDLGPDKNHGNVLGTAPFSSGFKPSFVNDDSKIDLEVQFLSVPVGAAIELGIFTGTLSAEDILVDYWNGTDWVNLFSDLGASQWNKISLTNLVLNDVMTIRFSDGTRSSDMIQDSWEIDAVILTYTNYQLEWEHQVQSIDLTKENYLLTIYGSSSDSSENFEIQMWNHSSMDWTDPLGTKIGSTDQWYNFTLTDLNILNTTIIWRYRGDNETYDNVQNTLNIDYAGIASYDEVPVFDINPTDLSYDEGTTGHTLTWDMTDDNPNNYIIFRDDIEIENGNWNNPQPISINVDGLSQGSYTYKIMITDTKGYHTNDSVLVTVLDGTDPLITFNQTDFWFSEGETGNEINWIATDNNANNYEIYNDTALVQSGGWNSGVNITINLDGLLKGVHNYTITVYDVSSNSASDTVQVTVIDTTLPTVDEPANIGYSEGSTGNEINWIANDAYAGSYQIWNTTNQITSGSWTSGVPITYNIDGLSQGTYNFTILIFDASGNSVFDTVIVTVFDDTTPSIDNPSDIPTYVEESLGNTIDWIPSDVDPANYEIYIDGQLNETFPAWISGVTITVSIDGLLKGDRNITILVYDVSGNFKADTVIVTVIDTTSPIVNDSGDFQYNEFSPDNEIVWLISDNYPATLEIYLDDVFLFSTFWTSGSFTINVDDLGLGLHNYTIVIFDKSSLQSSDTVLITVVDGTLPSVDQPSDIIYAKNSVGNSIVWIGNDAHPDYYTISNDTHPLITDTWISGATISINIDGLDVGLYNYTIVLFDEIGNQISDTLQVAVTAESVFLEKPDNIYYIFNDTGNELIWIVSDANPANYSIYQNGFENATGTWTSGNPITFDIDGLQIGVYNISILVRDDDLNIITHQLNVTVSDLPVWGLEPGEISYFEGSSSNNINWTATDDFENTYIIYKNGTYYDDGLWSNSANITLNINGLEKGVYNFTIVLMDKTSIDDTIGNVITSTSIVTVIDDINPVLSSPDDVQYVEGTLGQTITWLRTDLHPSSYEIWNSTHQIDGDTWLSNGNISYDITGLDKGVYNFTIIIYDTSGNNATHTVIVTVTDKTNPEFTTYAGDVQFDEGPTSETLIWVSTDKYAANYTLYVNDDAGSVTAWTSGADIIIDLDGYGLTKGSYNFTIRIIDQSGNSIQHTVWVTIIDGTDPIFTLTQGDLIFNEASTGNSLNWTASDTYNNTYVIYEDGIEVDGGNWISGNDISISMDYLLKGTYVFTITIYDESGNSASDVVTVTVNDNTDPLISPADDYQYSEGTSGHNIEWIVSDNYEANYEINNDVGLVKSGNWVSGTNITLDINGLLKGVYNYTITVFDASGNSVIDQFSVTVIDTTFPIMSPNPSNSQYVEGSTGNILTWDATDAYADTYEIWNETNQLTSNSWTSGVPIVYDIDGLVKGAYNFTIIFIDQSNNKINHTVILTVTDETLPVIDHPINIDYLEGETNVTLTTITWAVSDKYADYYEIYNGSNLLINTTWTSGPISLDVSGSTIGTFTYTITIYDLSGNNVTDVVSVQVKEEIIPSISNPIDLSFTEVNITGNYLNWTAFDTYPGTYTIYRNESQVATGDWNNFIGIIFSLDGLNKGFYNFTIFIEDSSFNLVTDWVIVSVFDELAPIIQDTSSPAGDKYSSGTTGNTISWTVTDNFPDFYYIIYNNVSGADKIWQSGETIPLGIDGLLVGFHNYTIVLLDVSGNSVTHTFIIEVSDFEAPSVVNAPPEGVEIEFNEGESTTLNLIFTDDNAKGFNITGKQDGIVKFSLTQPSWDSYILYDIKIDGLSKGTYDFTIIVLDSAGNYVIITFPIIVLDNTSPEFLIEPFPASLNYTEGDVDNILTWTMSDNWEAHWELYQNDTLLDWNDYSSDVNNNWFLNVPEQIRLDGFPSGIYNITLVIFDESDNTASSSVLLIVFDEKAPIIISVPTLNNYNETTTGNILTWKIIDIHAGQYNITLDGENYENGNWANNTDININIDGLEAGIYNFDIIFYDLSFNNATDTIDIAVFDVTRPVIIIEQEKSTFNLGATILEWSASDLHPGTYVLRQDEVQIAVGEWSNADNIIIRIDGLAAQFYNFTIQISDESGNTAIHSVEIRIRDPDIIDTIKPEIILVKSVYEGDIEVFNGIWTNMTGDPISDATIIVKLVYNLDEIREFGNFTNINGEYSLTFNYTGLIEGDYKWILSFQKDRYQDWQDIIIEVTVLPHTFTLDFDVPPTITQGEEYFISVSVSYANNDTSSNQLSLNELTSIGGVAKGVKVKFTFELEFENEINIIIKTAISDENGIALIKLTGAETTGLISVLSIKAEIVEGETQSSYPLALTFNNSELPDVVPGSPDILTLILNFVEDNVIVVPIVIILIITSISLSVVYGRRSQDKAKQLNRDVKSAFVELKAIKSIQSIIIQNDTKATVYEEQVSDTEMNINLIGGMVTAFSSFLNELGKSNQSGFEMMEREGISITAHKGKSSIFIVISSEKLPFVMLNQIQRAQQAIESSFRSNFSRKGDVKSLTKKQVHPKFDLSSFKVALKYHLSFNGRNIRNLLKEKSLSRALKQNIDYLAELPDTDYMVDSKISLENIVEFYKSKGITERVSSRTIILAYQYNIFEAIVEERE